jgi:type II secretion system protein N
MVKTRKWLMLGIYIVAAAVLFAYYLFPAEAVKGYIAYQLNAADPSLAVDIARVKPTFPPGLKLRSLKLARTGMPLVEAQQLTVRPVYASLLGLEKTYRFKGKLYQGTIDGTIQLNQGQKTGAMRIEARIEGLHIEQIRMIEEMSGRKVFGMLAGNIQAHRQNPLSLEATAKLELSDGKIELLMPVFTYKNLAFRSIKADLAITQQNLTISRCEIKAQPADGSFRGTIDFKKPLGKSMIGLEGTVKPHPALLALLRKSLPASLVPPTAAGDDGIGISLSGTLDSPGFAFQ